MQVDALTLPGNGVLLGVDDPTPLLAWVLSSPTAGDAQTAYEVQVGSAPGGNDVFASGKVSSTAQQVEVRAPLLSGTEYFARVRVWDTADTASDWTQVVFETGLFSDWDWRGAKWIGGADADPAPLVRTQVEVTGSVLSARLYVAGAGYVDAEIGGVPVSADRVLEPGYTVYDKRVQYAAHDVTELVTTGTNTLVATLGRGFYGVTTDTDWDWNAAPWHGAPRTMMVLIVHTTDGVARVVSDGGWQTRASQITADSIYLGEAIDYRIDTTTGWGPAVVYPAPASRVVAMRQPPIVRHTPIAPVNVTSLGGDRWVYDFGVGTVGWVRAQLTGPSGTAVTVTYGEKLTGAGEPDVSNTAVSGTMQTDRLTLNGGPVDYEPRFSYKGFRYVMFTGVQPSTVHAIPVHTRYGTEGSFHSSSALLNQLAGMAAQSMRINVHGIITDTPTHEKIGWLGDSNVTDTSRHLTFAADHHAVVRKWLADMADSLTVANRMPVIIPTSGWYASATSSEWSSAFVLLAHRVWKLTGDRSVIGQHFPQMRAYVDWWLTNAEQVSWGSAFGDWAPPGGNAANGGADFTATLFVILQTEAFADICDQLGVPSTSYRARAATLRTAYTSRLFDGVDTFWPVASYTGEYRQGPNVLALAHGLVPSDKVEAVTARLVQDITITRGGNLRVGILSEEHLLGVLTDNDELATAWTVLTQTDNPSWGQWAALGASTVWNTWGPLASQRTLSHHMHGSFLAYLYGYLAGVKVTGPGIVTIAPHYPPELTEASATVPTTRGPVTVAWDPTHITITVPPGVSATYAGTPIPPGITTLTR